MAGIAAGNPALFERRSRRGLPSGVVRLLHGPPEHLRSVPILRQEQIVMDKDRIAGTAKEVKGSVKEAIGKVGGDAKLQADGKAEQTGGKIQNAVGGLKDAVREIVKQ
jgi:uncharacterized protein YjbJ (UPF0337 family)